jgi:carbon storage regulator
MLILTRNQNESVIIDSDIKVTVISNRHGQVKLGIEAPDDVEIWREEIYEKLDAHLEEVEWCGRIHVLVVNRSFVI